MMFWKQYKNYFLRHLFLKVVFINVNTFKSYRNWSFWKNIRKSTQIYFFPKSYPSEDKADFKKSLKKYVLNPFHV